MKFIQQANPNTNNLCASFSKVVIKVKFLNKKKQLIPNAAIKHKN